MATALHDLAAIYHVQGQYAKAEPLYLRALGDSREGAGTEAPLRGRHAANLAEWARAGRLRSGGGALRARRGDPRGAFGIDDPRVAETQADYAAVLRKMRQKYEAHSAGSAARGSFPKPRRLTMRRSAGRSADCRKRASSSHRRARIALLEGLIEPLEGQILFADAGIDLQRRGRTFRVFRCGRTLDRCSTSARASACRPYLAASRARTEVSSTFGNTARMDCTTASAASDLPRAVSR